MTINLNNISFKFPGTNNAKLFEDFSISLDDSTNPIAILGSSGCGKTTLLRLIAGLIKPHSGSINFCGEQAQADISFVFQEPRLLPHLSVLENVMLPIEKLCQSPEQRARRFLALTGLELRASSYPNELSGGQAQRVSIARAWAYPAPLIILDEPFQSLDVPLRIALMDSVLDLIDDCQETCENRFVIAVTHDPREAIYLAKRIIVLGTDEQKSTKILFDEESAKSGDAGKREFICADSIELEKRLIGHL
ncbi:MAG: ABC transporter ATP-binding protein [Termitinemataceae bacterium]|nr:MAG: ABC transporter ATP-binding protein [Termitinemataceae bacterium]